MHLPLDVNRNFDFLGMGVLLQFVALLYLCYVALNKHLRFLFPVFLALGIGKLMFACRLKNAMLTYASDHELSQAGCLETHINGRILPYYEQCFGGIIAILTAISLRL